MIAPSLSLELSPTIQKQLKKLKRKNTKAYQRFRILAKILIADPFAPKLKTHKLRGSLAGRYAFSLDQSLRVVFRFKDSATLVLIALGTHNQVYR